jgi:hypothetical protein
MRAAGVNSVRTYHVPPPWVLDLAGERGLSVLVDVPWPKHLCFLDSRRAMADARAAVRRAAKQAAGRDSVLALNVGNEVPADVARWHGARRVEQFLGGLADLVKQADPDRLVTYASFPPTEYLDPPGLDFVTLNVYLHDREGFRRYRTTLRVRTAQEEHGGGKRLIRVAYRLRPRGSVRLIAAAGLAATALTAILAPLATAIVPAVLTAGFLGLVWRRGTRLAGRAAQVFDAIAREMNLVRCATDGTP